MSEHHSLISNENIVNFIAGLLGGFISVTVCNPLDIARSRLNVLVSLFQHAVSPQPSKQSGQVYAFLTCLTHDLEGGGPQGLLRRYVFFSSGYRTNVVAIPIFNSLFFPLFQYSKRFYASNGYNESKTRLFSTVTAGVLCNIITNPIWVVRTRLMVQYLHKEDNQYKKTAPFQVIREMVEQVCIHLLSKE